MVKAMELKMRHTALTPSQQEKYDHRFETMPELLEKEEPKFTKKKKKGQFLSSQLHQRAENMAPAQQKGLLIKKFRLFGFFYLLCRLLKE